MKFKNLHKEKWEKVKLGDVCDFVRGVTYSNKDEVIEKGYGILRSHNVDFIHERVVFHNLIFASEKTKVKEEQKLKKNDILISVANSKEQTGKVGFSYFDTDYYAGGFMAILRAVNVEPYFLFLNLTSSEFKNFSQSQTHGTTNIFNITFNRIKPFSFKIPEQEIQKQLIKPFLKIEETIEQTEKQEKALVEYRKGMVNTIFNHNENFGTLLPKKKKKLELFGNVAKNIQKSEKNPLENGLERFVGLEHIMPDNLTITSWGNIADGTTFTKTFKAGQILFGKRRAYLKKVAVADFDGLCSGDILVFDAIEKKILPELLPYLMQNDAFFEFAVRNSAGSLSPRTKWQDLVNFQFHLPDLKLQPKLVTLFKQIDDTIEQTRIHKEKLIAFKKGLLNELIG